MRGVFMENLVSPDFEVTPAIRNHVQKQVERLRNRTDRDLSIRFSLSQEGEGRFRVNLLVQGLGPKVVVSRRGT